MALYVIDAIRVNAKGDRITEARYREADGSSNKFIGAVRVSPAPDIADMILSGDKFTSVLPTPGGTVAGPDVRYVEYENGVEGIEAEDRELGGNPMLKLPRF